MTELRWAEGAGVEAHVAARLAHPGAKTIALPGGTTPGPILRSLAARRDIAWASVTILPTDERCVPVSDAASNLGMLHAVFGDTGARLLPLQQGMTVPRLDLAWLGMGLDGHVASLFPNLASATDAAVGVIAVTPDPLPPEAPYPRLSLTMATLAAAAEIILVIRGAEKRRIVEAAVRHGDLPVARLLRAAQGPLTVFWSET